MLLYILTKGEAVRMLPALQMQCACNATSSNRLSTSYGSPLLLVVLRVICIISLAPTAGGSPARRLWRRAAARNLGDRSSQRYNRASSPRQVQPRVRSNLMD